MLRRDRRGAVALWIALTVPTLLMALGLGIEVASWSVVQVELQRIADAAALAGSMNYTQTNSGQSATNAAANVAEVNGITGASSRTWNSGTQTLGDNNITAAVVTGIKNASDVSIKVIVTRNVPLMFANVFSSLGSITVTATAWSELRTTPSGPQPCFGALKSASNGGGGISMSGSTTLSDPSCSLRSNAGLTLTGNGTLNTDGIYAAGSISIPFWVSVTGSEYPDDGTISDSYQNYSALQTALNQLSPGVGPALTTPGYGPAVNVNPGTYSSFTTGGTSTVNMSPGLYVINGPISFSGTTVINGSGVTIVSSGSINVGGTFTGNLSAPGTSPTGGAVPGVLMASTGSSVSFSGGFSFPYTGVLYFPNAAVSLSGSTTLGSSGCAELMGGSLTLSGAATFSGNCSSYGAPSFGSIPATSSVALVQ
jgi:Flp pilus assembly protein TadG